MIRRIGFTLGALFLYRVGCHIPLPGIDPAIWAQLFDQNRTLFRGTGVTERLSPFALSIIPYFTAAILIQVAIFMFRRVRAIGESGEAGRARMMRITLLLTIALAAIQAYGVATAIESVPRLVATPGALFLLTATATLCGGVLVLVWLAEQITTRGIGNGIAWVLFATAAGELPGSFSAAAEMVSIGTLSARGAVLIVLLVVALVALVVSVELARRNFAVEREDGRGRGVLSVKINPAGIVPQMFAGWLMLLPIGILPLLWAFIDPDGSDRIGAALQPPSPWFWVAFAVSLIIASLVYTAFLLDPARISDALRRRGLRLPGVTPGEATAEALDHSISRLALAGAAYLVLLIVGTQVFFSALRLPFVLGGFALLVIVSTALDIKAQLEASRLVGGERP